MSEPAGACSRSIAEAYAQCAEVVRRRARNFYYGLRLTPEPKRSAIYSVYAWMRRADDEADAAGDPAHKRERLAEFRACTERMIAGEDLGEAEGEFVWVAFRETVRRHGIDPRDLRDMLDGLDADLRHELRAAAAPGGKPVLICETREELRQYCYRVASTVGLVCVQIWGLRDESERAAARELAIRRGTAFQLTNILRDFAQDYDERRVYLPAADLAAAGVSADDLRRWSDDERCRPVAASIAAWARGEYEASAPLDLMIDPACFAAIRTMTRIYSGLLSVIEREPSRIAGARRIRLQSAHKAGIALRACARAWVNAHVPATSPLYAVLMTASRR
ncbi:MAG: phytoene/squalene synthase family protein [Planctomycetota bacterium]|nr:phytoene/squalene synthase family protein [Planctomycetota bacterium]